MHSLFAGCAVFYSALTQVGFCCALFTSSVKNGRINKACPTVKRKRGLIIWVKTIAITNQKGGVGKTTTAINLAACLAEMGKRILLVDLDPQGNSTSGIGLRAGDQTVYEALMDNVPLANIITATKTKNLWLASADIRLAGAELELKDVPQREYMLKQILQTVEQQYDFIFIDCPPSLGLLTLNALTAAQRVLIPIQCEYYALEGVTSLMNTVNRVQRSFNRGLDIEGIFIDHAGWDAPI